MELHYLGHAAFDVHLADVRLCLDPHKPGALGGRFQLPAIHGPFDAVISTHPHEDHAAWTPELLAARWLEGEGQVGRVQVRTRAAFHDPHGGARMGLVTMCSLEADGVRIVHCGDLGAFDDDDVAWLRGADVLLVPAGGTYTLDGSEAAALVHAVQPRMALPMHCADPAIDLPLAPDSEFLRACGMPVWRGDVLRWSAGEPVLAPVICLQRR